MTRIQTGSSVTISYIGTLDDGTIFYNSEENGPLTVMIGAEELFPALEQAIIGMRAGEARNVVLSAEEGYGPHSRKNILNVARGVFPAGKEIRVGQKLSIEFAAGASRIMKVTDVTETEVTLDGNHPLAGMELTFALRVDRVE